jgi:hypothetical protein
MYLQAVKPTRADKNHEDFVKNDAQKQIKYAPDNILSLYTNTDSLSNKRDKLIAKLKNF